MDNKLNFFQWAFHYNTPGWVGIVVFCAGVFFTMSWVLLSAWIGQASVSLGLFVASIPIDLGVVLAYREFKRR